MDTPRAGGGGGAVFPLRVSFGAEGHGHPTGGRRRWCRVPPAGVFWCRGPWTPHGRAAAVVPCSPCGCLLVPRAMDTPRAGGGGGAVFPLRVSFGAEGHGHPTGGRRRWCRVPPAGLFWCR